MRELSICLDLLRQVAQVALTLLSVTEGDDKPAKYPVIFRASDLVVLSKSDLLDVLEDFDPERAAAALRALGKDTPMIRTAARRVPAIESWLGWLEHELRAWRPALRAPRPMILAPLGP